MCGSSGQALALQIQSPEFKPQSHQRKKKKSVPKEMWFGLYLRGLKGACQDIVKNKSDRKAGVLSKQN
jgi:hypothetical protein